MRPGAHQALEGVRIIDCTRRGGGLRQPLWPTWGLSVIKVEEPGPGRTGASGLFL